IISRGLRHFFPKRRPKAAVTARSIRDWTSPRMHHARARGGRRRPREAAGARVQSTLTGNVRAWIMRFRPRQEKNDASRARLDRPQDPGAPAAGCLALDRRARRARRRLAVALLAPHPTAAR